MSEQIHTLEAVALQLHTCVQTIRNYIKQGKLRAVKIGRRLYVSQTELDRALRQTINQGETSNSINAQLRASLIQRFNACQSNVDFLPVYEDWLDNESRFGNEDTSDVKKAAMNAVERILKNLS